MNLAVSQIAWPPELEEEALKRLLDLGVDRIELAPLRSFGDPMLATESHVRSRVDWYQERGFSISSFQALLFGTENTLLFGDPASRKKLVETLKQIGRIAGWCGAVPLVFGSPKNRLKGDMTDENAMESAVPVFREIGDTCADSGSCLVIEANPPAYGADFITTLEQAAELVRRVDSPGFALHLDGGGLGMSGENFEPTVRQSTALVRHVHFSQPHLADFSDPHPALSRLKRILDEINYSGTMAIEMRQQTDIWKSLEQAVEQVRNF